MARVVVQFSDGSPYGAARKSGHVTQAITFVDDHRQVIAPDGGPATDWVGKPKPPVDDDERSTVTATERMWSRATGRLVYRAGQEIPEDEIHSLIGDAERASDAPAEVNDVLPRNPGRRKR